MNERFQRFLRAVEEDRVRNEEAAKSRGKKLVEQGLANPGAQRRQGNLLAIHALRSGPETDPSGSGPK